MNIYIYIYTSKNTMAGEEGLQSLAKSLWNSKQKAQQKQMKIETEAGTGKQTAAESFDTEMKAPLSLKQKHA